VNWHDLTRGDTLVSEASSAAYTVVSIEKTTYDARRARLTALYHETGCLYQEDILDGPIHFFKVFRAS
jgi:hypothetical protein